MTINVPEEVNRIFLALSSAGYEAYLVGGCVRDALRGITPHDYDIASSATPDQATTVLTLAGMDVIPTGCKHGTVTCVINHKPFEITTFRSDGTYSDMRRPDSVTFVSSVEQDLARRDYTINAIAWNECRGFVDPYGGKDDIDARIIRCVGNPHERLTEDPLRIMRALRFTSTLAFTIDKETSAALHSKRDLLSSIAVERISCELIKLLSGESAEVVLKEYADIISVILPEIIPCIGFAQNNPYHTYDVWLHTLRAIGSTTERETDSALPLHDMTLLRLCLLFHDIGKPNCYTQEHDENGNIRGHFYGHAPVSAEIARKALRRLRFDNETVHDVTEIITHHCDPLLPQKKRIKRQLNKFGLRRLRILIEHNRADVSAQAPHIIRERLDNLDEVTEILDEVVAEGECFSLADMAVNGHDMIALGVAPSGQIKEILNALLDAVIEGNVENKRDPLLSLAAKIIAGQK